MLFTFAPNNSARRYIPLSDANPQYLPKSLADAVIAKSDPQFLETFRLLACLISPTLIHIRPSPKGSSSISCSSTNCRHFHRALRERILAAQITAQFGRTQILEWYLNSANFGRHAFGAETAAQLYFGKSATQLTTAKPPSSPRVSNSPSLNPYDAPQSALERGKKPSS